MHVSFALFADAANLSQEGKLNILGVFDAVRVEQFPAVHPRATLVVRLKAVPSDAGRHEVGLRWTNARGHVLWESSAELEIGAPPPGATEVDMPLIFQLDLPLDVGGTYRMDVGINGRTAAQVILHVQAGAPPVIPAPPGQLVS